MARVLIGGVSPWSDLAQPEPATAVFSQQAWSRNDHGGRARSVEGERVSPSRTVSIL